LVIMLPEPGSQTKTIEGAWARLKMPETCRTDGPARWLAVDARVMTATMANRMARRLSDDGILLRPFRFIERSEIAASKTQGYTSALRHKRWIASSTNS